MCCMKGKVKLPLLKKTHLLLNELLDPFGGQRSKTFKTQIRSYNAMFAMTSMVEPLTFSDLMVIFTIGLEQFFLIMARIHNLYSYISMILKMKSNIK